MDLKQDYIHFNIENNYILEPLEKNTTITYDLLHPVILVLNYFVEHNMEVDGEDEETINDVFSIGFHYLYSCMDHIKRILADNFNDDVEEMLEYDQNLYLYLRIDEMDTILEEQNELLSALLDQLGATFEYRKKLNKQAIEQIEEELNKAQNETDEVTMSDQFMDFADTLGLDII